MTAEKTRVTSEGQITLPEAIRDRMGVHPGDEIEFIEDDGVVQVRKVTPDSPFAKWRGYLKHLRGQRSDDLVNEMRGE